MNDGSRFVGFSTEDISSVTGGIRRINIHPDYVSTKVPLISAVAVETKNRWVSSLELSNSGESIGSGNNLILNYVDNDNRVHYGYISFEDGKFGRYRSIFIGTSKPSSLDDNALYVVY